MPVYTKIKLIINDSCIESEKDLINGYKFKTRMKGKKNKICNPIN